VESIIGKVRNGGRNTKKKKKNGKRGSRSIILHRPGKKVNKRPGKKKKENKGKRGNRGGRRPTKRNEGGVSGQGKRKEIGGD